MLDIHLIPVLQDNYVYVLVDQNTGVSAVVDPGEAKPVIDFLEAHNLKPSFILNTHHHWDHTNGNHALVEKYGCQIVAPAGEDRIDGAGQKVAEGYRIEIGDSIATVIETPAHTKTHICFYFEGDKALFCGDTLFSIGCGRLFEGSADDMFQAMQKLKALPDDTRVYCGHEYTEANIQFAKTVLENNDVLKSYEQEVKELRAKSLPSIPSKLEIEKKANPFMVAKTANELGHYRQLKDNF